MTTEYRFKPIEKRDDTETIKENCYCDSLPMKEVGDSWNTLYNDTYVAHPIPPRQKYGAPAEGFFVGGGNLAPEDNEMKSNYQQVFHKFDKTDIPDRVKPIPESDFIPNECPIPKLSSSQEAMKEAIDNRPPYDNTEAKQRATESNSTHIFFSDPPQYKTTYSYDFVNRPLPKTQVINNKLQRSSIAFDSAAGIGPHTRHLHKKESFPSVPDVPKPNVQRINFDIGYDRPVYTTTTQSSLQNTIANNRQKRPESFKAPPCATLADSGENPDQWKTVYETDFHERKPVPNKIDMEDLRKTHWTQGSDKVDYSRPKMAVATTIPSLESYNYQTSNSVFQGDGEMRFQTTSGDLIGKFDNNKDGRSVAAKNVDARDDHLFLGGDKTDYQTAAQISNAFAGKGHPAKPVQNLHHLHGVAFARGGIWDPNSGFDTTDEKTPRGQPEISRIDTSDFRKSHIELEATAKNKNRYKTTYFEDICRPKLAE